MPSDDEIKKPRSVNAHFNELGRTGLKHFSGTLYEEFLPQLQGERGMRVYREMRDNSAPIGAMFFAIESLLRSVEWSAEPANEKRGNKAAVEFLEECMHDMSHTWEDFISEVLSMLVFGWSYFEVVYKKRKGPKANPPSEFDDGRIGWRKFAIRAQDTLYRWEFDDNGGVRGLWQYPIPNSPVTMTRKADEVVLIPIEKSLLFRTTSTKGNPEGRSMLRNAYLAWYYGKRISEIEAIGVERDLNGIPIAKVPIELLAQDRTSEQTATYNYVKDIVTKTKNDQQAGIVWPLVYDDSGNELFKFELINSGGTAKRFDTGAIITRYQQQQVMTVLADFILLGHENVGSFALSSDKTEIFAVALGAWLDAIQEVINRHAVPRLFELNGFPIKDGYPRVVHGDIEKPDIQQLGAFIQSLAAAGAPLFPDIELENKLREMADLPPADPEEREKLMAEQAGMGLMFGAQNGGPDGKGGVGAGAAPGFGQRPQAPKPQAPNGSNGGGNPDALNAPRKVSKWDDEEALEEVIEKATSALRPRYYDGSKWKNLQGRHRWVRRVR